MFSAEMLQMMLVGFWETLYMTLTATACAYLLGIPLGLLLVVWDKEGVQPHPAAYRLLGGIVNILRSIPFLILLVWVVPVTRFIVGTAIGSTATVVPLVIAAAPYVARVVESSLKEVDQGVVEAAQSMGAGTMQIIRKVLLPEARPSLILGAAISTTVILGYSAMSGFVGGGGLGTIAINYGYYRSQSDVMLVMIVVLVIIVQIFQELGNFLTRRSDRRLRNAPGHEKRAKRDKLPA